MTSSRSSGVPGGAELPDLTEGGKGTATGVDAEGLTGGPVSETAADTDAGANSNNGVNAGVKTDSTVTDSAFFSLTGISSVFSNVINALLTRNTENGNALGAPNGADGNAQAGASSLLSSSNLFFGLSILLAGVLGLVIAVIFYELSKLDQQSNSRASIAKLIDEKYFMPPQ
jgi:hypothetical protein